METEYQDIRVDSPAPAVVRVTLAREKQLNAYSMRMCRELLAALQAFDRDDARARARAHRRGPRLLRGRRRLGRRPRARRVHAPAALARARDARRHAARDPRADSARQADARDDQRAGRRRRPRARARLRSADRGCEREARRHERQVRALAGRRRGLALSARHGPRSRAQDDPAPRGLRRRNGAAARARDRDRSRLRSCKRARSRSPRPSPRARPWPCAWPSR